MKRLLMLSSMLMVVFMGISGYTQEAGRSPEESPGVSEGDYGTEAGQAEGAPRRTSDMGTPGEMGEMKGTEYGAEYDLHLKKLGNADLFLEHSSELSLTDSQISDLRELRDEHQEAMNDPDNSISNLENELQEIVSADNPDLDNLKDKIRELQEARTERLISEIDYAAESRDVLNENQLAIDITRETPGMQSPTPGTQSPGQSRPGTPDRPNTPRTPNPDMPGGSGM